MQTVYKLFLSVTQWRKHKKVNTQKWFFKVFTTTVMWMLCTMHSIKWYPQTLYQITFYDHPDVRQRPAKSSRVQWYKTCRYYNKGSLDQ